MSEQSAENDATGSTPAVAQSDRIVETVVRMERIDALLQKHWAWRNPDGAEWTCDCGAGYDTPTSGILDLDAAHRLHLAYLLAALPAQDESAAVENEAPGPQCARTPELTSVGAGSTGDDAIVLWVTAAGEHHRIPCSQRQGLALLRQVAAILETRA